MNLKQEQIDNLYSVAIEIIHKENLDSDFMNILSSIWRVYEKQSTGQDSRYSVLGDEIMKHYIMNNDWPDDELFISILRIKEDSNLLLRFIQELLNYQKDVINEDFLVKINENLPKGFMFKEKDDFYVFCDSSNVENTVVNQDIKFYKCKGVYLNKRMQIDDNSIPKDIKENYFLLAGNNWDDYGNKTSFVLYYVNLNKEIEEIGSVKLMKINENNTYNVLNDSFYSLSDDFCSLGQDVSYYEKMYSIFGDKSYLYLRALRDVAVFSRIQEKFEKDNIFRISLFRDNIAEKALREGRYFINGRKMSEAYAFTYSYRPNYYVDDDSENVDIRFDFKYQCKPFERVLGLIGENGVGKTTLLKRIIESLTDDSKSKRFDGLRPIFSKVIAISYSPFDSFPTSIEAPMIDYLYCGLFEGDNLVISKEKQLERMENSIKKIVERNSSNDPLCSVWLDVMRNFFPNNVIDSFIEETPFGETTLNVKKIIDNCDKMSSGETIFVYAISDIIANIRRDSLLLFDEPEQHLHPHGIMQLIRALYTILEKFESYAIIATHSPLVIREMLSKNVFVFNRNENYLNVAKIGIECFGEDVSILNDVVFKNHSEEKQYEKYIAELVKDSNSYDDVVLILQNDHNELGLNARLLIQSAFENKDGGWQ